MEFSLENLQAVRVQFLGDEKEGRITFNTVDKGTLLLITPTTLSLLMHAMIHAGVDMETKSLRESMLTGIDVDEHLLKCFNKTGLVVKPEECEEIARLLADQISTVYCRLDRDFVSTWRPSQKQLGIIQSFANYCADASPLGGMFYFYPMN